MKTIKLTKEELSRMRKAREEKGFTQAYMAEKLCVSEDAYQKYEKGKRNIPKELRDKINMLLEMNHSDSRAVLWMNPYGIDSSGQDWFAEPEFYEQFYPADELQHACAQVYVQLLVNILYHYGNDPEVMGGLVYIPCVQNLHQELDLPNIIRRIKGYPFDNSLCAKLYETFVTFPHKTRERVVAFVKSRLLLNGYVHPNNVAPSPLSQLIEEGIRTDRFSVYPQPRVSCTPSVDTMDTESFCKLFTSSGHEMDIACSPSWVFDEVVPV